MTPCPKPPVIVNSDSARSPAKTEAVGRHPHADRHSEATEETPGGPVQRIEGVQEPERPRLVTPSRKTSTRFGPVQDIGAEEHQRRGDAAVALFREIVRRAAGNGGT